jgi:hypothetical protein
MAKTPKDSKPRDANRDPITKAPGAHPVGTGVGAAVGGVAGTVAGGAISGAVAGTAAGGPIGTAAGLVVGAVVGGLAGKKIGEKIDPTAEDAYWREYYRSEPYYQSGMSYDEYAPAYRVGYEGYGRYAGRSFEDAESDLRNDYDRAKGRSSLGWDRAKDASRAAWNRIERAIPGDSDHDGN